MGQIAADLAEGSRPETPLQIKLRRLASFVSKFGYLMAGLIVTTLMIQGWISGVFQESPPIIARYLLDSFMFAVIIIVVSVPEGLPVSVTGLPCAHNAEDDTGIQPCPESHSL